MTGVVRPLRDDERAWFGSVIRERWGADVVVAHGEVIEPAGLPALVAEEAGRPVGVLSYRVEGDACEIVSLDAFEEGRGVGTALLEAARALGFGRLWLVTTNDNRRAHRLYERLGFRRVAVRPGAIERARELKPEIPILSRDGTPIRDEYEYELVTPAGPAGRPDDGRRR